MSEHFSSRVRALMEKHLPAVEQMRDIGPITVPSRKDGPNPYQWTDQQVTEIVSSYQAGTGLAELADAHGVSRHAIRSLLVRCRVKLRKAGRLAKNRNASLIRRTNQVRYVARYFEREKHAPAVSVDGEPIQHVLMRCYKAILAHRGPGCAYQKKA